MSDQPSLTPDEVKEIFKKNGIESFDQLADMIAASSAEKPDLTPEIEALAKSWIIKFWVLEADAMKQMMPDHLGGDILNPKLGGIGDIKIGGVGDIKIDQK